MQQQQQLQSDESHWEDFYAAHLPPSDFEDNRSLLKEFCDRHNKIKSNIVLVTVRSVRSFAAAAKQIHYLICPKYSTNSLVAQQFRWNTTPFGLWIISVQAHGARRRPNIF